MENEIIPIDNAVMFNMVMSKKENCQGFIERALGIKVANLTILETEKVMEAGVDVKGVRLDVYVEDAEGVTYDIEMQANSNYKVGLVSEQLNAFLNYVVTQEPTDEYTKSLHDDVKIYSKDAKRRQAMMTVQDDIDFMNFLHKQELAQKDAEIAKQAAEIERLKAELAAKEQKG